MSKDLDQRLALCRNLPSLPAVAVQIISLAQDPDADLAEVARTIALDPALSTKLLRIANSPLYATARRVDNLRQALTVLGLNATLSLALGFSLSKSMRQPWGQRFDFQSVVRRSILAATAARCLGEHAGLGRGEDLLLAGLIQDIGILALSQVEPERYADVLAEAGDNAHLVTLERSRLGTDHAQVGARLAVQWGLPEFLVDAVRDSESEQPQGPFNLCVALSGPIADIWIRDEPDGAHVVAATLCRRHFGIDDAAFAALTTEISGAIPEISSLFDMSLADPQRIEAILDHARELTVIRNLKGLQEASRERNEAERLHMATRALRASAAATDPLAQLPGRAHFDQRLQQEFSRADSAGAPLTVAVVGSDATGDIPAVHARLRELALLLSSNVRETDLAARHGEAAFCLLLPATADVAATSLCWRILQGATLHDASGSPNAGVSIGIATLDAAHHYASADALLDAAEYALQVARDAGGNRIERAGF